MPDSTIIYTYTDEAPALATASFLPIVQALPKTRSGKVLRRAIVAICEGRETGDLTTIEDPSTLDQIKDSLQ